MTRFHSPTHWRLGDPLAELRAKLQRLEQTNDHASPVIADLTRIVVQRIAELQRVSAGTR
jgi:hypothetical protein